MGKFCYSIDGERYEGELDSREDALAEGRELYPDRTIWTGRTVPAQVVHITDDDVTRIIERKQEDAFCDVGEVCGGWLAITVKQGEDLRARLDAVFQAWLTENNLHPTWFCIVDDVEHSPANDGDAPAQRPEGT